MQAGKIEIFDWMTPKGYLNLSGNDLLVYAYIYNEVEVSLYQIVDELGINLDSVLQSIQQIGGLHHLVTCTRRNVHHPDKSVYVVNEDKLL